MAEGSVTLEPGEQSREQVLRTYQRVSPIVRLLLQALGPLTVEGQENVPKEGAILVLANHANTLDPIVLAIAAGRPIHFLATESLFDVPLIGSFLRSIGIIPKKKFINDARALRILQRWSKAGSAVGLFPEGQRTWDGRPVEVLPGIERLARMLQAPVVTARILNAERQWPRWAALPRRSRIHVVFDPPMTFSRQDPLPEIRAKILQQIRTTPSDYAGWPVSGLARAKGVGNLLFACPACFSLRRLKESGNTCACPDCGARWRVEADGLARDGHPLLRFTDAVDALHSFFAGHGMRDPSLPPGQILRSPPLTLLDRSGDTPTPIGVGAFVMGEEGFWLEGTSWKKPWSSVVSVSAEIRTRFWLRGEDWLVEPVMSSPDGQESVVKWEWFGQHWQRRLSTAGGAST